MPLLTIVVPCFRDKDTVQGAFEQLRTMEADLPGELAVEYIFVDDGSNDGTYEAVVELRSTYPDRVVVMKLTRNVGIHNALLAAFSQARGDCVTVFPPDLQEPVELIPRMYDYWRSGIPVVATVRTQRHDGVWKRFGGWVFHRLMRLLVFRDLHPGGHGTGLIDRSVVRDLLKMHEKNSNTILLTAWLGYPHVLIPYTRERRAKGRSGWSLAKKVKFFIDSVVGFSYLPMRIITIVGILLGLMALAYATTVLISAFTEGTDVRGWPTMMMVLLLTASFQMIALGVLGEYLWRTLDAVRQRPPYVVEQLHDARK